MSVALSFGVQEQIKKGNRTLRDKFRNATKVKNGDNLSEKNSA